MEYRDGRENGELKEWETQKEDKWREKKKTKIRRSRVMKKGGENI
jgi:hypothetical protein